MPSSLSAYGLLAFAIVFEVAGSSMLQRSEQFTRFIPAVATIACFAASLFFLSQALKAIPLGVAYAIWGGVGIILTTLVSVFVFRFTVDLAAIIGIALIVAGVVVINVFSNSVAHS
ncbi:DMT family transporter [Geminicoccus flavidas]|uniref:DMT family transporter n=1 Tax=Geminicoccus flavidas TaxID=2506407 RepID=UPI0013577AFC|nr:SMR family transporter [Geminicoccus flavidas]